MLFSIHIPCSARRPSPRGSRKSMPLEVGVQANVSRFEGGAIMCIPCVLSIMCTAVCLFRSAGGRRQVTSMSALLRVCFKIPVSSVLLGNSASKFRDPSWQIDTSLAIQNVTPCSSSIGISISVPCSSTILLNPCSSSYPNSSRRSSCSDSLHGCSPGKCAYGLSKIPSLVVGRR